LDVVFAGCDAPFEAFALAEPLHPARYFRESRMLEAEAQDAFPQAGVPGAR
jgi:hypothetical protein